MINQGNIDENYWAACPTCQGQGKKTRRLTKKVRLQYQSAVEYAEKDSSTPPPRPKANLYVCPTCAGAGILPAPNFPPADTENYPHVAIIGGGIGGSALAIACLHRGIPYTLYERDASFDARAQGYGLTLQQASKAIHGFGINTLTGGVVSTRHLVHTPEGKVVGEWGARKWLPSVVDTSPKRSNIHIARQSLRYSLLQQLSESNPIAWKHQLISIKKTTSKKMSLTFQVNGLEKLVEADLVVGADGIRSMVRSQIIPEEIAPLRYLGCIVILGICPLAALSDRNSDLLDSATVFQTANGNERIYMMPFDEDTIMWQLSFPISEDEAKALSEAGTKALKEEAIRRTAWHSPIPEIMSATAETQITGYPAYDRELLHSEWLNEAGSVTLIGDAAHPMSPFKGQGANQALLDALSLARKITKLAGPFSKWKENGLRDTLLVDYEAEMLERSAVKVKDSAEAAQFLHSEVVLKKQDSPRGSCVKR